MEYCISLGISTSREPRDIVTASRKGSKKHTFLGVSLQRASMAFFVNNELLGEVVDTPDQAGQIVTFAYMPARLEVKVGRLIFSVPCDTQLKDSHRYAAAVMDARHDLSPCWTIVA